MYDNLYYNQCEKMLSLSPSGHCYHGLTYKKVPPLIRPEHTRQPKASGPNSACLIDQLADDFVSMTSGTIITLTTESPTSNPLPNFQILPCESLDEGFYGDEIQPIGTDWRYAHDDDDDDDFDYDRYDWDFEVDREGELNPLSHLFAHRG
ncbi:hypothetical protein KEM56_003123 [Ascosphaera pollenicola]|nr:hypothetical protein KEM56_003123 [Ascosphaera pollenicola]